MIDKSASIVITTDANAWYIYFDSATQGEYAETLAGKTHTFTQQNVRYVQDYLNGSTVNSGNHWTEIEVWGTTSTAYVGDYFEWNGSLQTMTKYYYAGVQRVAVRNSNGTGTNGLVYLLGDHLSSASLTADPLDGDKLSELRYKAWGETRYALTSLPTDRRFTGQVEEAGIGLYFFNARWYDSALGRWAQPDSIVPVGSQGVQAWDRYAYVNNNPIKNNDPSGHCIGPFSFLLPYCVLGAIAIVGEYSKLMAEVDNLPPYEPEPTPLRPPASSTPSPLLTPSQTPSAPMVTNTQDTISIVDIVDIGENIGDTFLGADFDGNPAISDQMVDPYSAPYSEPMRVLEAVWGTKQQLGIDLSDSLEARLSATPPPTPTIGPSVTPSATPTSRPTYTPKPPTHTPTPYLQTPTATPY